MQVLERLEKEIDLVLAESKITLQEYKKWRRGKIKKPAISNNEETKNELMVVEDNAPLQKVYAIAQTTNNSINAILNTSPSQVLPTQKVTEILALINQSTEEINNIKIDNLEDDDKRITQEQVNNIVGSNNKFVDEFSKKQGITKQQIIDGIKNIYGKLEDIMTAKLPSNLLAAVALSNPLTAIVYQNSDLITSLIPRGSNK